MKCCLCGKEIDNMHSNNPFPLCHIDDYESRCCNECNENYVIRARIYNMGKEKEPIEPYNTTLAILWSSKSDLPIKTLTETGKVLAGQVTDLKIDHGHPVKAKGTWGKFSLNLLEDNYFILDI